MNKTILKLFTEACYHGQFEPETVPDEVVEKFTELIVREFANIVNSLEQYEGQGDCSTVEYIKEHFGVEE